MLKDSKISSAEIAENNVKSAANRLVGTANENKNVFDKLTELLAKKINNLVDVLTDLTEEGGASQIGSAPIEKLVGTNVRDQIVEILDLVCDRYTKQETEALALQETNDLISDLSIDLDTGIITVTKKDGTTKEWDTALEKVPATFEFIDEEGEYFLKITNVDETSSKVNVTSLMNIFEFENSDEVSFNASGDGNKKVVTASIRPQSIGIEKLSLSAISQLEEYSSSAQQSAIRAQNAKEETERLKNEVEGMYQETSSLSEQVEQDTNTTRDYYNEVAGMYDATREYTERAEAAAREVENAISGGDMYKSIYDKNGDGIVDNAEALEGHPASYFAKGEDVEKLAEEKVDKVAGKGLSTNDYTDADKEKVGNALPLTGGKMDGVLQTRGGDVNTEQIALGNNTFIYSNTSNGAIVFTSNAKTDDGTNWYRVEAGTASLTFTSQDGLTRTHKAESGEAGSAISWGDVESHLTDKTGLPLSGGTLLNSLEVFYNINPFFLVRTETQGMTKLWKACDGTQNWGSYLADMNSNTDFTCLILRNESDKENRIAIQKSGDANEWYRIYGEHNITCSTSAPTSALTDGCIHMTY